VKRAIKIFEQIHTSRDESRLVGTIWPKNNKKYTNEITIQYIHFASATDDYFKSWLMQKSWVNLCDN